MTRIALLGGLPLESEAVRYTLRSVGLPEPQDYPTPDDLPAPAEDLVVVSMLYNHDLWLSGPVLTARSKGHRVVVLGHADPLKQEFLQAAGIPVVSSNQVQQLANLASGGVHLPPPSGVGRPPGWFRLTAREQDVCALLLEDPAISRAELAEQLGMSPGTVKVHLTRIRTKLRAEGATQQALAYRIRVFATGSP